MSMNLSGEWNYSLDYEDIGLNEKWYLKSLDQGGFNLPGTTATNKIGDQLTMGLDFTKETLRHLRQHFRYVGAAWYQKKVFIPKSYKNKVVHLFLERVMFESRVWVNEVEVGKQDSLSTPHVFDLTNYLVFDDYNTITIRVDNRDIQNIGTLPSAYTDETQTIWNGIVGKIELQVLNPVYIENVQVYPNIHDSLIKVTFELYNKLYNDINVNIKLKASFKEETFETKSFSQTITNDCEKVEVIYPISELYLWDEFNPNLYQLHVEVVGYDKKVVTFGMREFKATGKHFTINGNKTFLRGTLDCCIFPLTGHPSMERSEWERILKVVKEYGLNHVRYHSWCPPDIAFTVADELGVYLCAEGPMWMDNWSKVVVGQYPEHFDYLPKEALRIQDTYGNHPSFVAYANGNELNGNWELMSNIIKQCKEHDPRRVYTLTSNWDRKVDKEDDFFVAQTVDGIGVRGQYKLNKMVDGIDLNFDEAVALRDMPVISHEVGQYSVYPDISEIEKFTGALRPINYESIKQNLEDKHLIKYAKDFTLGSGELALHLYKDELESALRTRDLAGVQLLDLHDFPGQSTATVGILNCFWESKGIITSEKFRQFCQEVVPLVKMNKRIYSNKESIHFTVEVANYSHQDLLNTDVSWQLCNQDQVFVSGIFEDVNINQGHLEEVGVVNEELSNLTEAVELKLIVKIKDTNYQNQWTIWVYPQGEVLLEKQVVLANQLNESVIHALQAGKKVILCPKEEDVNKSSKGKFFPVFWSPIHFTSKDPCGVIVNDHPIFKTFPTTKYINYQWKDLVENSFSISIDELSNEFEPIVQVIPNFFNNSKLTNLFECQVLNGQLMVCTIDLFNNLDTRLAARQLKNSLYQYVSGDEFNPKQTLTLDDLKKLFEKENTVLEQLEDLALNKLAYASSVKSAQHEPTKGNDGDLNTYWSAADKLSGHFWTVDLGEVYEISGTKITFSEAHNYLYAIHTSVDGQNYKLAVNQTGQTKKDQIRYDEFEEKARFVKVVYSGLPSGVVASHKEFKVFKKK